MIKLRDVPGAEFRSTLCPKQAPIQCVTGTHSWPKHGRTLFPDPTLRIVRIPVHLPGVEPRCVDVSLAQLFGCFQTVSWLGHSDDKLRSQCSTIYRLHPPLQQLHSLWLLAECGRNIHNCYLIAWHSNDWQACVHFASVMWMGDMTRMDRCREWREEEESWENREREGGQRWKKDVKEE